MCGKDDHEGETGELKIMEGPLLRRRRDAQTPGTSWNVAVI